MTHPDSSPQPHQPSTTPGSPALPPIDRRAERILDRLTFPQLVEFRNVVTFLMDSGREQAADKMIRGFVSRIARYMDTRGPQHSLLSAYSNVAIAYAEFMIETGHDTSGRLLLTHISNAAFSPQIPFNDESRFAAVMAEMWKHNERTPESVRFILDAYTQRAAALATELRDPTRGTKITDSAIVDYWCSLKNLGLEVQADELFLTLKARGIVDIICHPSRTFADMPISTGRSTLRALTAQCGVCWMKSSNFNSSGTVGFHVVSEGSPQKYQVRVVRDASGEVVFTRDGYSFRGIRLHVASDGSIALLHDESSQSLFDVTHEPRQIFPLSGHDSEFSDVAVSKDGKIRLALEATRRGWQFAVSNLVTGNWRVLPDIPFSFEPQLRLSPSGKHGFVIVQDTEEKFRVYSALTEEEFALPPDFTPGNQDIVFSPNESHAWLLGTTGRHTTSAAFELMSRQYVQNKLFRPIHGLKITNNGAGFGICGDHLICLSAEGIRGTGLHSRDCATDVVQTSDDGTVAFAMVADPSAQHRLPSIYDLVKNQFVTIKDCEIGNTQSLLVARDGSYAVAICNTDRTDGLGSASQVIDLKAGIVAPHSPRWVSRVLASDDGKRLLALEHSKIVDLRTGQKWCLDELHFQDTPTAVILPDGSGLKAIVLDRSPTPQLFILNVALDAKN